MRLLIFGNSGSGKSTLARQYSRIPGVAHLDLDKVAWELEDPTVRKKIELSREQIVAFTKSNEKWVIEGCYSSLISMVLDEADEIIFLNPGIETCLRNCRTRPWEPHKYRSKEDQDKNLELLLSWVSSYDSRTDEFSLSEHRAL